MSWSTAKLSDFLRVKHGYAFKGEFFDSDGPYVLLTPGSFNEDGGFRHQGDKTKYYTGEVPDGYILEEGDIVVAMTEQAPGLLGSSAWVPESGRYLHNQRLGRITDLDDSRLDRRFLYYLFNTEPVRHQVSATATGGKVRHTAPGRIENVHFSLPSLGAQSRIAGILLTYDDLIENNRRRMTLLEDAARKIFQEWFARLRFPGYEHIKVKEGVPQSWERTPLEHALILQRGFDLPSQDREEGEIPIYASTGINGYHSQAKVAGPGVVTGRSGTLGEVMYVPGDFWPLNTALWVKEFKRVSPFYATFLLREMNLKQFNGGASVPTLDRKTVHKAEILIPPKSLLTAFDEFAEPIFKQINNLTAQNKKLREARDLLLPRLMSGEIVV